MPKTMQLAEQTEKQRFLRAYPRFLLCFILPWLFSTLLQLGVLRVKQDWLSVLFYVVGSLALFPLYHMEIPVHFYRFAQGEPASKWIDGRFYRPSALPTGLLMGFITMSGYIMAHFLPWSVFFLPVPLVILLLAVLVVLAFWLAFRLGMAAILYDSDKTKTAQQVILASWDVTKGTFPRFLWFCLRHLWPCLLALILGVVLLSHFTAQNPYLILQLFKLFFMPCYFYVTVLFYSSLLLAKREEAARKRCK